MTEDQDLSPALGGDRAAPEGGGGEGGPCPAGFPPAERARPHGRASGSSGAGSQEADADGAEARGADIRGGDQGDDAIPPELEALARGFEAFFGSALREVSQRLPAALSAIEGLVDAVEEALTPVLNELGEAVREAGGAVQREHLRDGLGDPPPLASGPTPIPIEPDDAAGTPRVEIPPVDLPPGV